MDSMANLHFSDIILYHEQTKHHLHQYARSPGYMDWNNQPNPFRFYEGSDSFNLPFLSADPRGEHLDLYRRGQNPVHDVNKEAIAGFLELSLGLSAWKGVSGSRWPLRINPSSGNLHPTEAHLILPKMQGLYSGVFHYSPYAHSLEPRAKAPQTLWDSIYDNFPKPGFFTALTTIFWRESWKYGERAFRYCNHDIGHALTCMSVSANLFGWKVYCINGISDQKMDNILGFDRIEWPTNEREFPEVLVYVCPFTNRTIPEDIPDTVISKFQELSILGKPNRLSQNHVTWEIIDETASKTRKPKTAEPDVILDRLPMFEIPKASLSAAQIIRQRRSGLGFMKDPSISKVRFLSILDKTIPRSTTAPFDMHLMMPAIDLLIFVHNVEDLEQGLYFFSRTNREKPEIRQNCRSDFLWDDIDDTLPLYLLKSGNFRKESQIVSCHQDIAGNGVFSLGMIAAFKKTIKEAPWKYRRLFWESGMIGQVLYLEAEAHGFRGTGIGCFFDDEVHRMLGLKDNAYQSLYHFTIGTPLEDRRLKSYPPYYHLKKRESN
jgi:SagB-type dehydrogenase family enzyme